MISESVLKGHPDKISDQIADSIVDFFLIKDSNSCVAIEVMSAYNGIYVSGEVKSLYVFHEEEIVHITRQVLHSIYRCCNDKEYLSVPIYIFINSQSQEIFNAVYKSSSIIGAGDQGIMIGYAKNNPVSHYTPEASYFSRAIAKSIDNAIDREELSLYGPDGKVQLALSFHHNKLVLDSLVISLQHHITQDIHAIKDFLYPIIDSVLSDHVNYSCDNIIINPSGSFIKGGPLSDTGVTGRKIISDTYGPHVSHGGGAFSGKDPTKVDRSGAYIARYIAKNIVYSRCSNECLVSLGYAIGVPEPVFFQISFNGEICSDKENDYYRDVILSHVDLTPHGICSFLNLFQPLYYKTSSHGHFGCEPDGIFFPWEKCCENLFTS